MLNHIQIATQKKSFLRSNLCGYSAAKIIPEGTIEVEEPNRKDWKNRRLIFTNGALFTQCMSERNNSQVDNARDLDIIMLIFDLLEVI